MVLMGWVHKISITFGGETTTIKADLMFGHLEEQKCNGCDCILYSLLAEGYS